MPKSLMCALRSLFGQFGDKIKGLNGHLAWAQPQEIQPPKRD